MLSFSAEEIVSCGCPEVLQRGAVLVQSPEKLEATLKELQIAINKERALTTEAERRSRALQTKLDTISKVGAFAALNPKP